MQIFRRTSLLGLLVIAVCAASTGAVRAQTTESDGFALDRYEPSERGSEWFSLDSLDLRGHLRVAAGAVVDYANQPLVFYGASGKAADALVEHQLFLHVGASLVLWDRLRVGLSLPVAAWVDGRDGIVGDQLFRLNQGGALGDLRLSADVRVFGTHRGLLTGAVGASLWLPTGDDKAFAGDGRVRLAPRFLLSGEADKLAYAGRVGFAYRARDGELAGSDLGSELQWGASAGMRFVDGKLLVGPEAYGSTVVQGGAFRKRGTPVEAVIGAHYTFAKGIRAGFGVGPGMTRGLGSPKFRVLASVEYTPGIAEPPPPPPAEPEPSDRDADGIADAADACPDEVGVRSDDPAKNGCPRSDRDGDGIYDELDACPDAHGPASRDEQRSGCPDDDGDGILDKVDACPNVSGPESADPAKNGCPDTDGDTLIDKLDACPESAGPANDDPKKNGCPEARIEKGQIRILNQVQFKLNSAALLPASEPILEAVLAILREHSEITKVSVEGHTDNVGKPAYNKKLSEKRAASVADWLVKHGIDKSRMGNAGFGVERPLESNDTEQGRATNRRVEFHIREIDGRPADGGGER